MKYLYTIYAKGKHGHVHIGSIRQSSEEKALAAAKKKFHDVLLVERARHISFKQIFGPRVSKQERLLLVKNLQVILMAGVPIVEALEILRDQSDTKSMKKVTTHLLKQVEAGNKLAPALGYYHYIFDSFFVNMIFVGERSGTRTESLGYLAQHLEHDVELNRKVKAASIYPSIILLATLVLGIGMVQFVFPKLIRVFDSINTDLPAMTQTLLAIIRFLSESGIFVLGAIALIFISFRIAVKLPRLRLSWQYFFLHIPLFGSLSRSYNLALVTRTLGVLLKTGTPLYEALEITAKATSNLYFKTEILKARDQISQGKSLGEAFSQNKQFTMITARLVEVGERTGNLESNLLYLSDFYTNKIDYITRNLSTIIEPILLIIIGLIVGFVAISILAPIFEFTSAVGS